MKGALLGKLGMGPEEDDDSTGPSSVSDVMAGDEADEGGTPDAAQAAAGDELAAALKSGDGAAIISALKGAIAACKEY